MITTINFHHIVEMAIDTGTLPSLMEWVQGIGQRTDVIYEVTGFEDEHVHPVQIRSATTDKIIMSGGLCESGGNWACHT